MVVSSTTNSNHILLQTNTAQVELGRLSISGAVAACEREACFVKHVVLLEGRLRDGNVGRPPGNLGNKWLWNCQSGQACSPRTSAHKCHLGRSITAATDRTCVIIRSGRHGPDEVRRGGRRHGMADVCLPTSYMDGSGRRRVELPECTASSPSTIKQSSAIVWYGKGIHLWMRSET